MMKIRTSGMVWTKKLAPAEGAAAAARSEDMVMRIEILFSEFARRTRAGKWRGAYHGPASLAKRARLAKQCAEP